MAVAKRKVYEVKGIAGSGGHFRVGTLVENRYGAPGIVIRILPAYRSGGAALGPRAWVAYDVAAHIRTHRQWRTPEAHAREMQEAAGLCEVRLEHLYMLKPVGQAKHL